MTSLRKLGIFLVQEWTSMPIAYRRMMLFPWWLMFWLWALTPILSRVHEAVEITYAVAIVAIVIDGLLLAFWPIRWDHNV